MESRYGLISAPRLVLPSRGGHRHRRRCTNADPGRAEPNRILGVDRLCSAAPCGAMSQAQLSIPGGNAQLTGDQVVGNLLGHRGTPPEPAVHLDEDILPRSSSRNSTVPAQLYPIWRAKATRIDAHLVTQLGVQVRRGLS